MSRYVYVVAMKTHYEEALSLATWSLDPDEAASAHHRMVQGAIDMGVCAQVASACLPVPFWARSMDRFAQKYWPALVQNNPAIHVVCTGACEREEEWDLP